MNFVFVFGSNEKGAHGKGAALHARQHYGAIYGQGVGRQGNSYAIPTKDAQLRPLPLEVIQQHVADFLAYARTRLAEDCFQVTRVGCGLAGYTDAQMAPFFATAAKNCLLPEGWFTGHRVIVTGGRDYADARAVWRILDHVHRHRTIGLLIEGGCRTGADTYAREWADERRVPHARRDADWDRYGLGAGPRRNQAMLDEFAVDGVIAFPGNRGTPDMRAKAVAAGVPVYAPFDPR